MAEQNLRFATNGVDYDFPTYVGKPTHPYLIASTPRCGSNFLQRALWRTGCAGAPEEYLTPEYIADFNLRWNTTFDAPLTVDDLSRFIERLWSIRTSPNGAFGLKLHGSHLRYAAGPDGSLLAPFQDSQWIWIRRLNRIAQAVSYLMADQTGVWIVDGQWLPLSKTSGEPQYDRDGITVRLDQINREEAQWEEFFNRLELTPKVVEYEGLTNHYESSVVDVMKFLGVSPSADIVDSGIRRQATDVNAEWEARYRTECPNHRV